MFFRHEKPQQWTFEERISHLKEFGFSSASLGAGKVRVTRGHFAAIVENAAEGKVQVDHAGLLKGDQIATLANRGYQMFFRTPSGQEFPALAQQLKDLHAFDEDLREGLGLTSLYNLSLGTTTDAHLYDRVEDRDRHSHVRPWENKGAVRT